MILRRIQYELTGRIAGPLFLQAQEWRKRLARPARKKRSPGPFGPPLESTRKLKELMSLHYLQGRCADGAVPVA
ncbi:MAG: hypothetical protein ACXWLR_03770, partial [Myxococcales bacterium]